MTISLLHVVVPTLLALVVLILYINASRKHVLKEIGELKAQLEKLDNVPGPVVQAEPAAETDAVSEPEEQIAVKEDEEKEEKDEPAEEMTEAGASEYNTGKSGKIYTKEELELLIKE